MELVNVQHWRLENDVQDIAWLCIDCRGRSTNALSSEVLRELGTCLETIAECSPRGLIVWSQKDSGFIAGADVTEFEQFTDPVETAGRIALVHDVFNRLERFAFPTVARIHGFCLGGGLELALACRYRVALDGPETRLGFPEVMLGIHPGFGGTVRSVRDIGVFRAMDLMLTGRTLDARRAKTFGLVDRAVPERYLDTAARAFVFDDPGRRQAPRLARLVNTRPLRPLVAKILRREVAKRAPERYYPAPYALLRLWREYGGDPREMMRREAQSVGQLLASATSRNLVRLFFLQERLKSAVKESSFNPEHVHVIGAGTMGGDIAAWCALRGMRVTLQDREARHVAPAIKRAHALFKKRVRDPYRRMETEDRLTVDLAGHGVRRADIVIEAIIEDLGAKRELFEQLESRVKPGALLATNTSSIPLEDIAAGLSDAPRLVGIHFFNPVARMQLIEIIGSPLTRARELHRASTFATRIDRLPLPAASAPGFLINRILSPYLQEAMSLVEGGVAPATVDEAATSFGMPMGPIELADTVGLDICLSVGEVLAQKLGGEVPEILRRKVAGGRLGRKSKVGFYEYQGAKVIRPQVDGTQMPAADIRDRLILRLLNEAVTCLREGVVADADLVDAGMVFGTGFAPFRGGPLHYAKERGVNEIRNRLEELAQRYGAHFSPDPGWDDLVY